MSIPNPDKTEVQAALSAESAKLAELEGLVGKDLKALLAIDDTAEDINYAQVLQRLGSSEEMAKGLESKLDSILENLDSLLESLGSPEPPAPTDAQSTPTQPEKSS